MSFLRLVTRQPRDIPLSRGFPGISVAEAMEAAGDGWHEITDIERLGGVKLPIDTYLSRVLYTQLEIERASQRGFRLIPSCCTPAHLARIANGFIRLDRQFGTTLDMYRRFEAFAWHLVEVHDKKKVTATEPPLVFIGRSKAPPLPVYLLARYLELMLRTESRCQGQRLTGDIFDGGHRAVVSEIVSKGCPILSVNLTAPGSLIPEARAWVPHTMVAR